MADTKTEKVTWPSIARNDVTVQLEDFAFGKKAKLRQGVHYPAPRFGAAKLDDLIKFFGAEDAAAVLDSRLKRIGADIMIEVLEDNSDESFQKTGKLPMQFILDSWKDFTAGFVTLDDLENDIEELVDQQAACALDEEFGARQVPDGVNPDALSPEELNKYPLTKKADELQRQVAEINGKLKPLRTKKKQIESKYQAIAAKRQAKKAAAEATEAPKS
jgi:hypothetical protein